ncbi:MAG TPA: polysaccharide deacetylase family protein [Phycisphaerales bacterium]|jgi:polysaccharide deacetylase family protein (PEP-CTERM system associated)|nr:polysaccharide deacetylase family protein [Phycisphaerales bacterium]
MQQQPLNAFCVDLEEWWHICAADTPYNDPSTWDSAPPFVVKDTEVLMRLLDEAGAKGTFLTVGWVADKYPDLIRRLANAGHEIGCHTYYHRVVYEQTANEFDADIGKCLKVLREISGQPVTTFRAPGFSMKREAFAYAYPILRKHGIEIDVSIVPAARDHGGVEGFTRDPFVLNIPQTRWGPANTMRCWPVSVMDFLGKTTPFSGGGYLRLFPMALVKHGYRQNHAAGRPGMSYIHPREIDPEQPRLKLPWKKGFKYYVGIKGCEAKLREVLRTYRFTTITETLKSVRDWPAYDLVLRGERDGDIVPAAAPAGSAAGSLRAA